LQKVIYLSLLAIATAENVKWCAESDAEFTQCESMVSILNTIAPFSTPDTEWDCFKTASKGECVTAIGSGDAHLLSLDGGQLYDAIGDNLQPIVAENYGGDVGSTYYSIAVVKANSGISSLADLEGKKACHTGYRKTAGWMAPIGTLVGKGVMSVFDASPTTPNDIESHKNFFGDSCAPGSTPGERICDICKDGCDPSSAYAGYEGALKCLVEDAGEVAFVKHTTPDVLVDPENYRIVCPDGGVKAVSEYRTCHFANVPSHVVVAKTGYALSADVSAALVTAAGDASFADLMFSSTNNDNDYIFKSSTDSLDALPVSTTVTGFLGSAMSMFEGIHTLGKPGRWCVINAEEEQKCQAMMAIFQEIDPTTAWGCVMRESHADCAASLNSGTVEFVTLDGADLYEAEKQYGVRTVVAENYGGVSGTSYFAVAVVRADSGITSLKDLEGKNACHTGYKKTAGWSTPVGTLIAEGVAQPVSTDAAVPNDIETMQAFFGDSCAPGSSSDARMCGICGGNCEKDSATEPYYGYSGAFRCLVEGDGDVAFVKHSTVADYTQGGSSVQDWGAAIQSSDYRLLCRDGGAQTIGDYEYCNLNRVVAHAVVTGPQITTSVITSFQETLAAAEHYQDFIALFLSL
jgi:ABC-type phosphate/phosphonate transport system substrate-binding protein